MIQINLHIFVRSNNLWRLNLVRYGKFKFNNPPTLDLTTISLARQIIIQNFHEFYCIYCPFLSLSNRSHRGTYLFFKQQFLFIIILIFVFAEIKQQLELHSLLNFLLSNSSLISCIPSYWYCAKLVL